MNKLGRKNSSDTPLVTKKKLVNRSPRNPLTDLSDSSGSGSVAAPSAKGSGKASPRVTLARSKLQPETPQSAPSSRTAQSRLVRGSPVPSRTPSRLNLQGETQAGKTKPQRTKKNPIFAPEVKARRSKSSSLAPSQNFGRIVSKSKAVELGGGIGLRRIASKARAFADCTPEKPAPTRSIGIRKAGRPAVAPTSQSTPGNEGQKRHSSTPTRTATTPPIQASISPEISCGPSVQPTPSCFAAGHRVVGVPDKRKCRARGILKVSDDGAAVKTVDIFQPHAPDKCISKVTVTPPLPKASMQWFSSPSAGAVGSRSEDSGSSCGGFLCEFRRDASVNWLFPPAYDDDAANNSVDVLVQKRYDCETTSPVSNCTPELEISEEYILSTLETAPSVVGVCKTPGTDSSISPFSMILKKAEDISGLNSLRPKGEARTYNYGSQLLHSSIAEELPRDGNMVPNPPTYSGLNKQLGSMQSFDEDKLEDVEIVGSSSPQRKVVEGLRESSMFLSQSFQFGCTASSSNSVDLNRFYKTPHFQRIAAVQLRMRNKEGSSSESESRISQREGLLSQMFIVPEHGDGDGFGSFEYIDRRPEDREYNESDDPHKFVPLAESISIENERWVSLSDSDGKVLFKNQLFEV